jgi:hypothetical protein
MYQMTAFGNYTPAKGGQQIFDLVNRMINKK